jgi:competence protein ComEA
MSVRSAFLITLFTSFLAVNAVATTLPNYGGAQAVPPKVYSVSSLSQVTPQLITDQVNINRDDAGTLAHGLSGIGQKRAQAIIEYRDAHGPFKSVDALTDVKGIGKYTVDKNRDRIVIG